MFPAEPAGGGVIARVLLAALKWAKSKKNPEISESEFIQIAKVTVFGSNSTVNLGGPGHGVSGEEFDDIIRRCFDAVIHQPGLRIGYKIGADGGRSIRIENVETYQLPDESDIESYTILTSRRQLAEGRPKDSDYTLPYIVESDSSDSTPGNPLSIKDIDTWTADDYATFTERLLELPDDVNLPSFPRDSQGES